MLTLESFCNSVWESSSFMVQQSIFKNDYKTFSLPKKNGTRIINYLESTSKLRQLQLGLLAKFLNRQELPVCVKGFRKGESYKSFLSEHIGGTFFLRVDIASFFSSISEQWIKNELSYLLLCESDEEKEKLLALITEIVTLDGVLPQGACTSPAMSNLVMVRIDQRITKYCQVFDVRYTRYADDLLFSSRTFNFKEKKWFIKKIKYILNSKNLKINYSKIKFGDKELALNGYIISGTGIRLSRNRMSDIRRIIAFAKTKHYLIKECGVERFLLEANRVPLKYRDLQKYPFKTVFQFIQYLCGLRAFLISMIDSNNTRLPFQKELQRLINRIETEIMRFT